MIESEERIKLRNKRSERKKNSPKLSEQEDAAAWSQTRRFINLLRGNKRCSGYKWDFIGLLAADKRDFTATNYTDAINTKDWRKSLHHPGLGTRPLRLHWWAMERLERVKLNSRTRELISTLWHPEGPHGAESPPADRKNILLILFETQTFLRTRIKHWRWLRPPLTPHPPLHAPSVFRHLVEGSRDSVPACLCSTRLRKSFIHQAVGRMNTFPSPHPKKVWTLAPPTNMQLCHYITYTI